MMDTLKTNDLTAQLIKDSRAAVCGGCHGEWEGCFRVVGSSQSQRPLPRWVVPSISELVDQCVGETMLALWSRASASRICWVLETSHATLEATHLLSPEEFSTSADIMRLLAGKQVFPDDRTWLQGGDRFLRRRVWKSRCEAGA